MRNRARHAFRTLFLLVLPLAGCIVQPEPGEDTTPPDPVVDLRVSTIDGNEVGVEWTAPGDDGQRGTASRYEVRYSSTRITEKNWEDAGRAWSEPRPARSGTRQGVHFVHEFSSDIYVAVRAADEVPNWSGLSNVLRLGGPLPLLPDLIRVPSGTFTVGDGQADCGQAQHQVHLSHSFHLGRYEVTNKEFRSALQWACDNGYALVDAVGKAVIDNLGSRRELVELGGEDSEITFRDGDFLLRGAGHGADIADHPVKEVSWYGAAAYCDWLSLSRGMAPAYNHGTWRCDVSEPFGRPVFRLPTDAEWERAARFDDGRIYPWGSAPPDPAFANYGRNVGWTTPVGSYPAGVSQLGFHDLAGNVWEWCNDWHRCDLGEGFARDPVGPESGEYRVVRGGSWEYFVGGHMRCAARYGYYRPHHTTGFLGFRLARSG